MMSVSAGTRGQVIGLYRRVLRLSKRWIGKDPSNVESERSFIQNEAKTLFRQNKGLTDPKAVGDAIQEAEARIEIALHYGTPYPRPVNVPPKALARRLGKEQGVAQERLKKQARPIYVKSLDSTNA